MLDYKNHDIHNTTNNLTVERALYGTSAADKDAQTNATSGAVNGAKVYFHLFNIYSCS